MSFDLIIRAFFSDGGLSAGLAKANAGLAQIGKSGPGARTGLRAVEQGARALAFEAAGLAGPMGRVFSGLLQIGGGSAAVVGAVAGIGAIALAYNALTKESRDAAEAEQKHREELIRSAQQRAQAALPASQRIGVEVTDVRETLDSLNARRAQRMAFLTATALPAGADLQEWLRTDGELLAIDKARADLSAIIAPNRRASANATKDEKEAAEKLLQAEQDRARLAQLARIEAAQSDVADYRFVLAHRRRLSFTAAAFGAGTDTNDPLKSGRGTTFGQGLILDRFQGAVFGRRAPEGLVGIKPDPKDVGWIKSGAIIAQGFFQAVTAFKSGGTGGVFGGFGALATSGAQIPGISAGLGKTLGTVGFVGSVIGGLFSLFDHSAERRQREQMAELTRIRQNTDKRGQPDHISVTVLVNGKEVTGAILQDVMYGIRRAERTNAVPVLPPSGG